MKKEVFDVEYWFNIDNSPVIKMPLKVNKREYPTPKAPKREQVSNNELWQQVNELVGKIEDQKIDITSNYEDWRDIAFALSDTF